jgi:serine/threonine-protein kinase
MVDSMKTISKRLSLLLAALAFLAQAPPPAPPAKTSVAIYPIKAVGAVDKSLAATLTSLLTNELTKSPSLIVIKESMLEEVMKRQAMNVSDLCDDTMCQVEIGKLVQAQKMVVVELSKLGARYLLTFDLVDIKTSAMDFSDRVECACSEDQLDLLVAATGVKVRNHFGESVPIPALPQAPAGGQAFVPAQSSATPQGAQAFVPVQPSAPAPKTFQEFHPPDAKGGPMVFVSDFKFYIDKFEVTNQDYQECVAAGTCKEAKKKSGFDAPQQPVVFVSQEDARTYCQWAGKRLPKEQEWQEAAQGTDGREYPWGNQEPNCSFANYYDACKIRATLPVGSKPAGDSPYGALDMAGNVYEWVEEAGVLRGGSWGYDATYLRVSYRYSLVAGVRFSYYGFRCLRDGSP